MNGQFRHKQIQLACEKVLAHPKKYRASLNYGGAQGSPNLIASLRRFHIENRIGGITEQTLKQPRYCHWGERRDEFVRKASPTYFLLAL